MGKSAEAEMTLKFGEALESVLERLLEMWPEQLDLGPLEELNQDI